LKIQISIKMNSLKLFILVVSLTAWATAVPEMDCYRKGNEVISFQHREKFTLDLSAGLKDTSRKYDCNCIGSSEECSRLDCRIVQPDEKVTIQVFPSTEEDVEEEEPERVVDYIPDDSWLMTGQRCTDKATGDVYEIGAVFLLPGTPNKGCKCIEGGVIICTELSCQMAPTPNTPLPEGLEYGECFDPWMKRTFVSGSNFNRTRKMSEYQNVLGTYSCSCRYGTTRCQAIDIPCCDAVSGLFKGAGEAVTTFIRARKVKCTCQGGRSSFRNCQYVDAPPPTVKTTTRVSGGYCVDRYSGKTYKNGATFYQNRGSRGTYRCNCRRSTRGNYQTTCRKYL